MSGAVPLLAQAEREGRHWRELLDDSALHPRLVVRPPNGLLRVWHREAAEGPPDQLLDLSKLPCTARADDFWSKKAVAGNLWSVMFNSTLQRDQHTPHTDNLLLPVDFWSHIPEGCKTVRVSLATLQDSDGKPYGVRFTPQHIWVLPPRGKNSDNFSEKKPALRQSPHHEIIKAVYQGLLKRSEHQPSARDVWAELENNLASYDPGHKTIEEVEPEFFEWYDTKGRKQTFKRSSLDPLLSRKRHRS